MQTRKMSKFNIKILLAQTNLLTLKKIKKSHLRITHFLAEMENGATK